MKRKWIETGRDFLVLLNNHLLMVSIGVTAMGLCNQDEHQVWLWFALFAVPVIYYWARRKISNFFWFFTIHLAVPVGILLLDIDTLSNLLMIFICAAYFIWSANIKMNPQAYGEGALSPVFMICALGGMLIIETVHSKKGWDSVYIALAILYVVGYLLYLFISRYLRFLVVNESSVANIPEKEILKNGFFQSGMYILGVAALLLVTANLEWMSYVVSRIGNVVLTVLRFLFSGIGRTKEAIPDMQPLEQSQPDMGILADTSDPALFWIILEEIGLFFAQIFLIGMVVFGIFKGFQYLWNHFYESAERDETGNSSSIDIRETCGIEKSKREATNLFLFLNNREKIRKTYRKQVLKNKTVIIGDLVTENMEYMTAKECCDKFSAEPLKEMYEKARYSNEEISSEDVKTAKNGGQ